MATYDPKRSRPTVAVDQQDPAPVEELIQLPTVEPDAEETNQNPDAPPVAAPVGAPITVEVSPSPFEPAGPPDQRLGRAIAIGVTAAGALALMVAWRRRRA